MRRYFLIYFLIILTIPIVAQNRLAHHINHIAVEVAEDGALRYRVSGLLQATWPYETRYFSTSGRKNYQESWGVWLGARDFVGVGDTLPGYAHVACGNFYTSSSDIIPLKLQKSVRYPYPSVRISDGKNVKGESFASDEVVESMRCDEQIASDWTTTLGLTVQLKTYAYASAGNQDYIIYDYTFTNTGNTDTDGNTRELLNTLNDVWLGFNFSTDIKPRFGGKDDDDYYRYYGSNYADWVNGDTNADSARIIYVWDGDEGLGQYEPDQITAEPLNPGYYAVGFLHVDKQAIDNLEFGSSDDPSQPKTVQVEDANQAGANEQYQKMAKAEIESVSGQGAVNFITACGPYNIPINQDVRIVLVQIIAGMSRFKAEELGFQLLAGDITQNEYEEILDTGKDSVFAAYAAAKYAFDKRYNIPDPPPHPDSLLVTAKAGKINILWSDNAESALDPDTKVLDFAGYRIYRSAISPENPWEIIFECGGNSGVPITYSYDDENVLFGFDYYYAVVAFDDGTQNKQYPGKSLESSRLASTAYIGAMGHVVPETTLKDVRSDLRVVPNPYNIRSRNFGNPNNASDTENNKLLFVGLPSECKIRIYTVSGDLVKVIDHDNSYGSESWNLISDSQQYIVSGIYIASIESDLGIEQVKFVVIR